MKCGFEPREEKRLRKLVCWLIALIVIAAIYFTWQGIENSKVYYVEKHAELAPTAEIANVPFGIKMKVWGMPWEDIVWDDEEKYLHMTIRNSTGTITNAEELRTYHMTPSGLLQGGEPLEMREIRGLLTVRLEHRFENHILTLTDKRYQKELCQIDLSEVMEEGQTVSGISVGYRTDITIDENGEKIYLYVTPGYQIEGVPEKIIYENMPVLKAEIIWNYDDVQWAVYNIGEFDVAWINEESDAVLAKIQKIDENGLTYNEVEWINETGARRQELRDKGLEIAENMIFIYDQKEEYIDIPFSEDCEFLASTGKDHNRLVCLDKEEMLQRVKREKNEKIVYYLVIEDEKIVKLQEQYVTKY